MLDWLDDRNQVLSSPYLVDDDEENDALDIYPAALSVEELRDYYLGVQERRGSKREIIDRIIEGDWRHGLTLYQLAMADLQYLYDHPTSQKWTALKVVRLNGKRDIKKEEDLPNLPRFHPSTFLQNLQREVLPDVKVHYNLDRHPSMPLMILRVFMADSPYNTSRALSEDDSRNFDATKTIYVAFPDASPYIFVSLLASIPAPGQKLDTSGDGRSHSRSFRKQLLDGLPKAFSKPRERYALESTAYLTRTLASMVARRGAGRTNAAGGGWEVYANTDSRIDTPLDNQLPTPDTSAADSPPSPDGAALRAAGMKRKRHAEDEQELERRRKRIARARFGDSALPGDGKGIERFDVRIEDPFPLSNNERRERRNQDDGEDDDWSPEITITLNGTHVFAGVRELVEAGVIDGARMPGWLTGEEGVSIGVVKDGRIPGYRGSGV